MSLNMVLIMVFPNDAKQITKQNKPLEGLLTIEWE